MPFYEYKCETCGHEMEKFVRKMDSPDPECPECRARLEAEADGGEVTDVPVMKKKVSQTSFKLEGGGWYKDGYG